MGWLVGCPVGKKLVVLRSSVALELRAPGHRRAKLIAENLQSKNYVASIYPVDTNIVIFQTENKLPARQLVEKLNAENIRCIAMNETTIRMVTHLDFDDDDLDYLLGRLQRIE